MQKKLQYFIKQMDYFDRSTLRPVSTLRGTDAVLLFNLLQIRKQTYVLETVIFVQYISEHLATSSGEALSHQL